MTSYSARLARLERQTELAVTRFSANPIVTEGFRLVDRELPGHLRYHTAVHTHEVFRDAVLLGVDGGLRENELELLAIAAVYHDLGYVKQWGLPGEYNEAIGARLAAAALDAAGYPERAKRLVHTMILDTQLVARSDGAIVPHAPSTPLSKYLLDADVGNLGKDVFFEKVALLYAEDNSLDVATLQDLQTEHGIQFLETTLGFLDNHRWHTASARRMWGPGKHENTALLCGMIRSFRTEQESKGTAKRC